MKFLHAISVAALACAAASSVAGPSASAAGHPSDGDAAAGRATRSYGLSAPGHSLGSAGGRGALHSARIARFDQAAAAAIGPIPATLQMAPHLRGRLTPAQMDSGAREQATGKRVISPPGTSTSRAAGVRATQFPGVGQGQSGFIPPDVSIAAGANHLIETVNGRITIFSKTGSSIASQTDGAFFSSVTTDGVFDPQVAYDQYIGRFVVLEASESDAASRSSFLLAVSQTSDPTQGWRLFSFDARVNGRSSTNNWCDYPHLGYSSQALLFTCNMFQLPSTTGGFQYTKIRVISTPQLTGGAACCFWWDFWNQREGFLGLGAVFTIMPARMHAAISSDGAFLAAAQGGGGSGSNLHVYRVRAPQNCCVPGRQTDPGLDEAQRGVGSYSDPPDATQPFGVRSLDTGDSRLLYAGWRFPFLFTGQNTGRGGSASVTFTEFRTDSYPSIPTPVNDWVLSSAGQNTYYPAVDVNASDDKSMVYSRSGTGELAGTFSVNIPRSSSCTFCTSSETTLQAGASTYLQLDSSNRNRWGDYSGASRDPDGIGIWVAGEAVTSQDRWGTQIARVR